MAESISVQQTSSQARDGSYIDWPSALAGAIVAGAVSSVLLSFGSGIGLSLVSPWPAASSSIITIAAIAAVWTVFVQLAAFGSGGYLAGRMRRPWADSTQNEREFRDGAHGGLVWATGVVIGGLLLALATGGTVATTAAVGSTTPIVNTAVDSMFRTTQAAGDMARRSELRQEASRLLTAMLTQTSVADSDRTYLGQLVASGTGLPQTEAEQRVNTVVTEARNTAEKARKTGIVASFMLGASLLAGAAIAWWAARTGGQHRDQGIVWRGFSSRRIASTGQGGSPARNSK